MELNFDSNNSIIGSTIISYLLEKSRVTTREQKIERNYHIFYQILRGYDPAILQAWNMKPTCQNYSLLSRADGQEAPNLKDEECFRETMEAFHCMGFGEALTTEILRVVCAVLHLGNVEFDERNSGEASSVASRDGASGSILAATLLQVDDFTLSHALCNKTMKAAGARKSVTIMNLNPAKAADSRDSFARGIFDKLFLRMVATINDNNRSVGEAARSLGLLDVFGFEIFEENSMEQLCINLCNEMLQNHFNFVIFTAETELYAEENIVCESIVFKDNRPIIDDIEVRATTNNRKEHVTFCSFLLTLAQKVFVHSSVNPCQVMFKALDEEAKIPKGSSKTWFEKMKKTGSTNLPNIEFPNVKSIFVVKHYAGKVTYVPEGFLEKNVETLSPDLVQVLATSTSPLLASLFADTDQAEAGSSGGRSKGSSAAKSITWHFQNQLNSLMTMLKQTESHFIRCIKSNAGCKPMVFEPSLVQKQLLYSGVFEGLCDTPFSSQHSNAEIVFFFISRQNPTVRIAHQN